MVFLTTQALDSHRLGKVVKSNSHCDYVVQVDDSHDVTEPPSPESYGFGQFVTLQGDNGPCCVGLIYNSQLVNPQFLSNGPRLSSEPDPLFTPDLISETRTLLGVILVGTLVGQGESAHGIHGIPPTIVPVNTAVYPLSPRQVYRFHCTPDGAAQFRYYNHLLRSGGLFAPQLAQQVLQSLIQDHPFSPPETRALTVLCKELTWKNTLGSFGA